MIRIPESIMKFSNGNVDLYKAWGDYFNHYQSEYLKKNVDYDKAVTFAEKTEKLDKRIKEEINKICGTNNTTFSEAVWQTNPTYRWATFAVISSLVEMILPDIIVDSFGQFSEVRNGGFGDSFVFDIRPSDLFIITKAGNGKRHAFAQRQFSGQDAIIPENRTITVEEDLYRILAGKVNLAEFAMKCMRSMENELALDIYTAVNDTYSSLPANFKAASYTQDGFVQLCNRVKAANGGASVTVFGTQVALSKILPTNDYLKMQVGGEYVSVGYVRNFMGYDLMALDQKVEWKTGDYEFQLDDTRLYVVSTGSQKLVKVCLEGNIISITDTQFQNANLVQTTTLHKKWGVGLITNSKFGIIDLG